MWSSSKVIYVKTNSEFSPKGSERKAISPKLFQLFLSGFSHFAEVMRHERATI